MTTLVYKDGVIAWDSRVSSGDTVLTDSAQKRYKAHGKTFWLCGTVGDFADLIRAYGLREKPERDLDVGGFVLDSTGLRVLGYGDGEVWSSPVTYPRALGSGSDFAYGAMDCGRSAIEALRVAAGRDTCTGGKLRQQKLK